VGAFPWNFILSTKRPLAGQSTNDTRSTVAAIVWAFGYLVNCAAVLVGVYYAGYETFDFRKIDLFDRSNPGQIRAIAIGYIGWSCSMTALLVARAVLDRWPESLGRMFVEDPPKDYSYVTVTSGHYKGAQGRVMGRNKINGKRFESMLLSPSICDCLCVCVCVCVCTGTFFVKLKDHLHVKRIPGSQLGLDLFKPLKTTSKGEIIK
jgi:hypothetical protein